MSICNFNFTQIVRLYLLFKNKILRQSSRIRVQREVSFFFSKALCLSLSLYSPIKINNLFRSWNSKLSLEAVRKNVAGATHGGKRMIWGEGTGCRVSWASQEEPGEGERPILRNCLRLINRGLHDERRLSYESVTHGTHIYVGNINRCAQ